MMETREIVKERRLELRLTMKEVVDHVGVSSPANIDGAPQHCLHFPAQFIQNCIQYKFRNRTLVLLKKYKENIKKVLTRY